MFWFCRPLVLRVFTMPLGKPATIPNFISPGWLDKFTKQMAYFHRHERKADDGTKITEFGGAALAAKLSSMQGDETEELNKYMLCVTLNGW